MECKYKGREDLLETITQTNRALTVMQLVNGAISEVQNEEWTIARVNIMKSLLDEKYNKCPAFRDTLMSSTGILVEATDNMYWASGVIGGISATKETPSNQWPGQNKLGRLLMELRESKQRDEKEQNIPEENLADNVMIITSAADISIPEIAVPATTAEQQEVDKQDSELFTTVILTDSILCDAVSTDTITVAGKGGAHLGDVPELLHKAARESPGEIAEVVIAIGITDVMNNTTAGQVNVLVNIAVDHVADMCPNTPIFLSSILPRKGKSQAIKECNKRIIEVNSYMEEYAKHKPNLAYINSHFLFNTTKKALYKDSAGLHLSEEGIHSVMNNIEQAVSNKGSTTPRSKRQLSASTPPSTEKLSKLQRQTSS